MSLFAAGQIGGRGTWIQPSSEESKHVGKQRRLSWESATETSATSSSKLTPSISKSPPSEKALQNRMATMQAGIRVRGSFSGSLTAGLTVSTRMSGSFSTSGRRFQPHSPNSSPPPTPNTPNPNPIADDWDETQTEVMEVAHSRSNAGTPTPVNIKSTCIATTFSNYLSCQGTLLIANINHVSFHQGQSPKDKVIIEDNLFQTKQSRALHDTSAPVTSHIIPGLVMRTRKHCGHARMLFTNL